MSTTEQTEGVRVVTTGKILVFDDGSYIRRYAPEKPMVTSGHALIGFGSTTVPGQSNGLWSDGFPMDLFVKLEAIRQLIMIKATGKVPDQMLEARYREGSITRGVRLRNPYPPSWDVVEPEILAMIVSHLGWDGCEVEHTTELQVLEEFQANSS